ncbi:ABC transporter substrate-binding protein [Metabacillus malikii]|uniref:Multiple sugar transport system substrate-binding protein n=1 Tax=Metabacillus malikii TaxID=1504265 RepID=A0ABT9ZC72_9BACI|nr:sugar ABC transporter substrate-binding protein [Metabacillus malikii]MDQ0229859.1 multiple sugar transport system substrate-binding protein [Metabacillus malikii]
MRKRSFYIVFILFTFILSGCSKESLKPQNEPEQNDKVQITFWDDNAGPQRTPLWETLIEQFEQQYPNIDVKYVGLPKDFAKSRFDAAIAAGDMPDVASVYTSWLPEFSHRDALLPLDSYVEKWSEKDNIKQETMMASRNIVTDHKLYGIPYTENLDILWIRSDLLRVAAVKPPTTWDDFFTAVEKLTNKSTGQYGYTIRGGAGGSFQLQRMMYAYSGIHDYFKDGKSTINDEKHVEFLTKYLGLYQTYTPKSDITNDYKAMVANFDTGVAAIIQHNIGSFAEHSEVLTEHQFQAIPLPKSIKGHYVVESGNTIGLSIFKNTKYPDEAWEFVRFINSKAAQTLWNQTAGQIPTHKQALDTNWLKKYPHLEVFTQVHEDKETAYYEPPFYLPEYRSILNTIVDPGLQDVLSGKMSVQEFLDTWANAMESAQAQYEGRNE